MNQETNGAKVGALLLEQYQSIFRVQMADNKISWATRKVCDPNEIVRPTIPFIGKRYGEGIPKILLYASAENLSKYSGTLDNDFIAVNRHRAWFDKSKQTNNFFPNVHIAPISDGCLIIALKYICEKLDIHTPDNPKDFLESIAFGNFGKFSIATMDRNIDYATDYTFLQHSEPYVKADIEILQPDLILMINTIYRTEKVFMNGIISPNKLITISQINASTINQSLHKKYPERELATLSKPIQLWYSQLGKNKIKHKTKRNFLSLFTYLDTRIPTNLPILLEKKASDIS